MVRKKLDRTVVKRCPQCKENIPVACKFCTCGHQFSTRNKILLKEEAEEAMGLNDGSSSSADTKGDDNSSENRRRPRRLTRERPNYYVITTELNRQVKKKTRQKERNRSGTSGSDNASKKKKRGRPRGSGASTSSAGTRTRSKTKKLLDHYPSSSQSSHGIQIKKEDLGFSDTKSSSISSLSYGCVGDKPLTNVTVSICTAPNSCCTANLSNCNITKHHVGINSNYTQSSGDGANSTNSASSHGKESLNSNNNNNTNGYSNAVINNIKNQVTNDLGYNSSSSSNNNNCNNNNSNQKDGGGTEKDMYSCMSFEKAMKFYAILADLNRKIISQSFKPL